MKSSETSASSLPARLVRTGLAGLFAVATVAGLATGCLDRPVAESQPTTKNLFVDTVKETAVDKIDLLFMIDNSISMADKQNILAKAVPRLVDRLINPIGVCTDSSGKQTPASCTNPSDLTTCTCPTGKATQEFKPIKDIHIGIVTSSLGGHGPPTNFCNPQQPNSQPNPTNDDHAHLLPKVRTLTNPDPLGFLAFDGSNGSQVESDFAAQVKATGEQGCGFESSLEAWYRFLAEPTPPTGVTVDPKTHLSSPTGKDNEILAERKNFLRPDSLLAIIMLTDEDDCSISDSGLGWLVAREGHMPRATATCATDPNSPCCRSCSLQEAAPPSGCTPIKSDPSCQKGAFTSTEDALNLRCFQQKRRFGLDLLYPTQRYVNALTQLQICPKHADLSCGKGDASQANPIFTPANGGTPRDKSLVFFAAITGVPWQDIATSDTLKTANTLTYKTADQIAKDNVWDDILGDGPNCVQGSTKPGLQCAKDPLMVESIDPRSGTNPITNDPIAPPSAGVMANPINGHEYDSPDRSDLQYACIFPLAAPRTPSQDCPDPTQLPNSPDKPLCQDPSTGKYGTTQYFAKAYPGLRQLQVLKDFGSNSIVASICPKVTTGDPTNPNYGYNPAVGAIIERLKTALNGHCLPRKLTANKDTGLVPCEVVEAMPPGKTENCSAQGRAPLTGDNGTKLEAAVRARLKQDKVCDGPNEPTCSAYNMCLIKQLAPGPDLDKCLNKQPLTLPQDTGVDGYCYIDQTCVDKGTCSGQFIAQCAPTEKRYLRFVGADTATPANGANVFIACAGATYASGT